MGFKILPLPYRSSEPINGDQHKIQPYGKPNFGTKIKRPPDHRELPDFELPEVTFDAIIVEYGMQLAQFHLNRCLVVCADCI